MIRLLLTILSLLMALPAAAMPACHDAAPVSASAAMPEHTHHAPTPPPAAAAHDCIGCIPPDNWSGRSVTAPVMPAAPAPAAAPATFLHAAASEPSTPPPRAG